MDDPSISPPEIRSYFRNLMKSISILFDPDLTPVLRSFAPLSPAVADASKGSQGLGSGCALVRTARARSPSLRTSSEERVTSIDLRIVRRDDDTRPCPRTEPNRSPKWRVLLGPNWFHWGPVKSVLVHVQSKSDGCL